MSVSKLVPEILAEDPDYQVFLSIIDQINNDIRKLIEVYPELVDINNCETLFLPKLTELLHYKFKYKVDNNIKREILSRIIDVYRDRGTDESIVQAASYGDNPLWVGSHTFLPGQLYDEITAEVSHPTSSLFKHNISRFSGSDRYPDGVKWRSGVIIIRVSRLNDDIKQAILNVIPAGLKAYIEIDYNIGKIIDLVSFENWFALCIWYDLEYYLHVSDKIESLRFDISVHDKYQYSGRQVLYREYETDYYMADIFQDNNISRELDELCKLDIDVNKSNNTDIVTKSCLELIKIDEVVPKDTWYPVSAIANLHAGDYLENYCTPVEESSVGKSVGTIDEYSNEYYGIVLNK